MRDVTENLRAVEMVRRARPTVEGAGVNLVRAFHAQELPGLDPFLMLDDFHSDDPADYEAGFPSHPHRGMETVTYMIKGSADHKDSIGNRGTIGPGDVQWMTAGSGIIHGEMPHGDEGMQGFQLWINLPRASKMMAPRYQDIKRDMIPVVKPAEDVEVRVIAGKAFGAEGPVKDLVVPVEYLDVKIGPGGRFGHDVPKGRATFAYVFEGQGSFGKGGERAGAEDLVVYGVGAGVEVTASDQGVRFLLVSGEPVREPIAWRGPVVMNTEAELRQAFDEIRAGTFVKSG
ncbi:MAG: pirin family protein [Methanomassiliicoccus sp.]|nr:pirin family protein [Methanomassiliicoccus sp.]